MRKKIGWWWKGCKCTKCSTNRRRSVKRWRAEHKDDLALADHINAELNAEFQRLIEPVEVERPRIEDFITAIDDYSREME
jgi:hypothetical protein